MNTPQIRANKPAQNTEYAILYAEYAKKCKAENDNPFQKGLSLSFSSLHFFSLRYAEYAKKYAKYVRNTQNTPKNTQKIRRICKKTRQGGDSPFQIRRIVTCLYRAYFAFVRTPHFADVPSPRSPGPPRAPEPLINHRPGPLSKLRPGQAKFSQISSSEVTMPVPVGARACGGPAPKS